MSTGWEEKIWSIEVMVPGLVSKGFLVDLPDCLHLGPHGILCDFPNKQATQGGGGYDPDYIPGYYPPLR